MKIMPIISNTIQIIAANNSSVTRAINKQKSTNKQKTSVLEWQNCNHCSYAKETFSCPLLPLLKSHRCP